jgi:DNA-directed RNA polymerase specialized sigma24 family protein
VRGASHAPDPRRSRARAGRSEAGRRLAAGNAPRRDGEVDPLVAEILDLHDALEKLSARDESLARLVELRFFAGLTLDEAADARGVSRRKAAKDWSVARLWLQRELTRGD